MYLSVLLDPVERCSESTNSTFQITAISYRHVVTIVSIAELYAKLFERHTFQSLPFESALVEFVRPMKVDQLCVMVRLVKESTSTSIAQEEAHNHN